MNMIALKQQSIEKLKLKFQRILTGRYTTGKQDIGRVSIIGRFEQYHLIAGVYNTRDGRKEGLRSPEVTVISVSGSYDAP